MSQNHPRILTRDRAQQIISQFVSKRVLVAGDLMLDEFLWGKVSRISPEAPVPVVEVIRESYYPGGAANVARNLREFTPHVSLLGLTGEDSHGTTLHDLLAARQIGTAGIGRSAAARTTVKTRVIARQQQVVRVDRETRHAISTESIGKAGAYLNAALPATDAIICADYGKGFLTQPMVDEVFSIAHSAKVPVFVDPNPYNPINWPAPDAIKPNRAEALAALGNANDPLDDPESRARAAHALLEKWQAKLLLLTLGEQGMWLFAPNADPHHTPARAKEVFDVSGAGDTAIALFTLALVSGAAPWEAAEIANAAAGVVVGKLGTATLTPEELLHAIPS